MEPQSAWSNFRQAWVIEYRHFTESSFRPLETLDPSGCPLVLFLSHADADDYIKKSSVFLEPGTFVFRIIPLKIEVGQP